MMSTKQIVVDEDLHRQFHQDCVRRGVTMRSATERLIKDALGDGGSVDENLEKMYVDSAASTATGAPMLRYGGDDSGDTQQLLQPRTIKVHDDKSDW